MHEKAKSQQNSSKAKKNQVINFDSNQAIQCHFHHIFYFNEVENDNKLRTSSTASTEASTRSIIITTKTTTTWFTSSKAATARLFTKSIPCSSSKAATP
jgi:hypothetical protein